MEQYYGGSVANVTWSVLFDQPVDVETLQAALNTVLELYDALRIRLDVQDGTPMQCVSAFATSTFEVVRFSSMNEFTAWTDTLARTPFDLQGDLYRFTIVTIGQRVGFVCHLHHLTCDAWTVHLLVNAVSKILNGEATDAHSYLDYLTTEREYETSTRREKDKAYFLSRFERCSEPVYISNKQANSPDAAHLSLTIGKGDAAKIQAFCESNSLSPYSLFMTALATYMYRVKGEQELYIGTAVLNRSGRKEKVTAGMFVNTVPVLFHIDETQSALQNAQSNAESISSVFRHQKYQYGDLLKDLRDRYSSIDRLFDVVLSYQNAALDDGARVQFHFSGCQGESLLIHINDRHQEDVFRLDYTYQTELFSQRDIERLNGHWLNLIIDIIENPGKVPQALKMLSDDEYEQVIYGFNDTEIEYPKDKCIHQLFGEQAARTPDAIAVIFEGVEYTYRQINEMANSLAHILRDKGVGRDDIVAIIARRSYKIIVAQLAILKAGGAFMPIDPDYPHDRIEFMLEDANCKTALSLSATVDGIDMEDDSVFHENPAALDNINSSSDLCYVIYTSGSTGTPKATMVAHRSFVNFCDDNDKNNIQAMITSDCKSLFCLGAFTFDMASAEVYLALLNNHTLVLPNDSQLDKPEELARLMIERQIDFILTTPTRILSYMSSNTFAKSMQNLKVLSLGGETLTQDMVSTFKTYTDSIILNGYGPAETTQGCTWTRVDGDITIGKPIANTQIYILDKWQNPLPIGAIGELCISGDGVGRGYLNRPTLTAEKFVPNPFIPDRRIYKSGDLARWREDGNIEFAGRMDNQVKIRGLRIELDEIETAMARLEGIKQAAVADKKDSNGRKYICAYYVSDDDLDEKELRTALAKKLPRYMIPHFFTRLAIIPTTSSGKTDRKSLPSPDFTQSRSDSTHIAPVSEREKTLIRLMEAVLGMSPVGMEDDFFDLGGDSLATIELTARAHDEGFYFTAQDVYEYPTPAALIKHIENGDHQVGRYRTDDFSAIHKLLESNRVSDKSLPVKQALGDVLITGATGWLGAHVLDEFLSAEPGTAYCLVRGKDLADSRNRLSKTLEHYFGGKYINCARIIPVCGDIAKRVAMDGKIDTIIHCAANVKHYGAYKNFHDVNVGGTENMIALAREKGAKLLHISTASVSGNSFEQYPNFSPAIFDETSLYIGQPLENVYIRSKFESEVAVLQAKLEGLDAAVIRVGNLSNRRSDLMFQRNYRANATLTRLKAFIDLKLYPESLNDFPLEFSPVDDTAKAILTIARHWDKDCSIFHAYNPKAALFADFARTLAAMGEEMRPVPVERFIDAVQNAPFVQEAFIHDIGEDGKLTYQSNITLNNDFTVWHLNSLGFDWPETGADYLTRYIAYFRDLGYLGGISNDCP
jgi:amino acid adenylation domain-containing protein/thioester reductase-like protein